MVMMVMTMCQGVHVPLQSRQAAASCQQLVTWRCDRLGRNAGLM